MAKPGKDYVEMARAIANQRRKSTELDRYKSRRKRYATAANLPKPEKPPTAKNRDGTEQSLRLLGYLGGV